MSLGHQLAPSVNSSTGRSKLAALLGVCVVLVAVLVPWISAGDHALYPPDEGRYATVSKDMANGGSWLLPMRYGRPHLTKPPLAYWLQAGAIRIIGPTSLAPRLPSLLAGSATTLLAFMLARRLYSARMGVIAAALLGSMPIHVAVQRLAITDSLLSFFWFAALAAGLMAVETGRRRWAAILWVAIAAGLMTKGPVALLPIAALAAWLAAGHRLNALRRLHVPLGLTFAVIPLAAWAIAITVAHPDAIATWRRELVDRAVGSGDHSEPFWFFLPVVLVGCFPATAMLTLPVFNTGWGAVLRHLRSGSPAALFTFAVLVPLVVLSLNSGKLPTYMLPLAAPLALLAAHSLEHWLEGRLKRPVEVVRAPDVRWTLVVVLALVAPAAVLGGYWFVPEARPLPVLFALPLGAAVALAIMWPFGPAWRERGLCACFAAWMLAVIGGLECEDALRRRTDPRVLLATVEDVAGVHTPPVLLFGLRDTTLPYYAPPGADILVSPDPLDAGGSDPPRLVVADEGAWHDYSGTRPECAARFELVASGLAWFDRRVLVLRAETADDLTRR